MKDFIEDLRSRINPAYADQPGTESFERQLCADAIERLDMEATAWEVTVDNLRAEIAGLTREQIGLALDAARYQWLRDHKGSKK
jgi:hypothetical protein